MSTDLLTAVVHHLSVDHALVASLEYPGTIHVPHAMPYGQIWVFGTGNDRIWQGDLVSPDNELIDMVDTQIAAHCTDARQIAEAIAEQVHDYTSPLGEDIRGIAQEVIVELRDEAPQVLAEYRAHPDGDIDFVWIEETISNRLDAADMLDHYNRCIGIVFAWLAAEHNVQPARWYRNRHDHDETPQPPPAPAPVPGPVVDAALDGDYFDTLFAEVEEDCIRQHHDAQAQETLTECLVCGGWDEHKDGCPVPVISAWLDRGGK